ncbi:hypothetical protein K431DRAFT_289063 [Polychaeton citri CBS 116435]|uniref:BSD domain-containing protein n=1 Tax=Polychaeton citri CBS 116435 TaxID=1314669 RepID=A0A9P4PXN8_9PEZI|nr:hypothetical protein K431DRAFT_289063 [Polychaeton citri CBS 116435]
MDVAYDHIQEEALSSQQEPGRNNQSTTSNNDQNPQSSNEGGSNASQQAPASPSNLNEEFQQAFAAVSASPWGSKLGGWFSTARKQGESFYNDLSKEASEASEQATKGFVDLRQQIASRTRGMSLGKAEPGPQSEIPGEEGLPGAAQSSQHEEKRDDADKKAEGSRDGETAEKPESLPADIVKEATSLVASFRLTAASKLKDIQKAEDAADEALLRFGGNVRDFLRNAVTITAPEAAAGMPTSKDSAGNEVLFETSEPGTGKKVFHTTRLDAQLHAIHTTASSFTRDPAEGQRWESWTREFDTEKKTEDIAKDLDKHQELRRAMEKLVPEKVEYKDFWRRYYFLRMAVEEEERRRKEVLKGSTATAPDEEIRWDNSDEEDDENESSTPNAGSSNKMSQSTTTLNAPAAAAAVAHEKSNDLLKPKSPRRSHEEESKSVADSESSYDIVSGATSRAPGSPKEEKKKAEREDESDDDWE